MAFTVGERVTFQPRLSEDPVILEMQRFVRVTRAKAGQYWVRHDGNDNRQPREYGPYPESRLRAGWSPPE